jgi:hypothetical protein
MVTELGSCSGDSGIGGGKFSSPFLCEMATFTFDEEEGDGVVTEEEEEEGSEVTEVIFGKRWFSNENEEYRREE